MLTPAVSQKLTMVLNGIQQASGLSQAQLSGQSDLNGVGFFDVAGFVWDYYKYAGLVSAPICMYHGYKRNNGSVLWTIVWGGIGYIFPIIAPLYAAFKQGYAIPLPQYYTQPATPSHV